VSLVRSKEEETIDHLLVSCAIARQFWFILLSQVNLLVVSPQPEDSSFLQWWEKANRVVTEPAKKDLDSLFILGAWVLWKHRNRCVFDAAPPNLAAAVTQAGEERLFWENRNRSCSIPGSFSSVIGVLKILYCSVL
jgi:hypothetical protein